MKLKRINNPVILAAVSLGALLAPQAAFAGGGGGVSGLMSFLTGLMQNGMVLVGAALALAGLIALGMGVWDIIQHFKPENRDNPDQKSRAVSGVVKFIMGGLLATGAYQTIANTEDFTASIVVPTEVLVVEAAHSPINLSTVAIV